MNTGDSSTLHWLLSRAVTDPERGILTLVGPTGGGKTWDYKHMLAALGYDPVVVCNPAVDLPEDIGGLPRIGKDGKLRHTQPSFVPSSLVTSDPADKEDWVFKDSKWALVIDELDKAREDVQSVLLPLLEERRIRHKVLPRQVPIVCAMNEPKRAMRTELLSRLILIPYPLGDQQITQRPALAKHKWLWDGLFDTLTPTGFPERIRSPRAAHRLTPWIQDAEFWSKERELARTLLIQGACDRPMAEVVLSRLAQHRITVDPIEWAKTVTPRQFIETVIDVLTGPPIEIREVAFRTIVGRAKADESGEWVRVYEKFFGTPTIFEAIGDPSKRDAAMQEIHQWLKQA